MPLLSGAIAASLRLEPGARPSLQRFRPNAVHDRGGYVMQPPMHDLTDIPLDQDLTVSRGRNTTSDACRARHFRDGRMGQRTGSK